MVIKRSEYSLAATSIKLRLIRCSSENLPIFVLRIILNPGCDRMRKWIVGIRWERVSTTRNRGNSLGSNLVRVVGIQQVLIGLAQNPNPKGRWKSLKQGDTSQAELRRMDGIQKISVSKGQPRSLLRVLIHSSMGRAQVLINLVYKFDSCCIH